MHLRSTTEFEELVVQLCRHRLHEEKVLGLNLALIYSLNGSRMAANPKAQSRCKDLVPTQKVLLSPQSWAAKTMAR